MLPLKRTSSGSSKCSIPSARRYRAPQFRLRAVVKYYDTYYREYGTEEHTADFSPCTEEWQFASVQFSKDKYRAIQDIRVYCDYSYNVGTAYFDDIQLVRNSLETNLSESDFTEKAVGGSDAADTEAEEDTGKTGGTDKTPEFAEAIDRFGNALTETTFTDGEFGTIYRSFGFTSDCNSPGDGGNDKIRETDARKSTKAQILFLIANMISWSSHERLLKLRKEV